MSGGPFLAVVVGHRKTVFTRQFSQLFQLSAPGFFTFRRRGEQALTAEQPVGTSDRRDDRPEQRQAEPGEEVAAAFLRRHPGRATVVLVVQRRVLAEVAPYLGVEQVDREPPAVEQPDGHVAQRDNPAHHSLLSPAAALRASRSGSGTVWWASPGSPTRPQRHVRRPWWSAGRSGSGVKMPPQTRCWAGSRVTTRSPAQRTTDAAPNGREDVRSRRALSGARPRIPQAQRHGRARRGPARRWRARLPRLLAPR